MFKVLTLNLNHFGARHGDWELRRERLIAVLRHLRPDIAAFQAVGAETTPVAGQNQAQQLAVRLPEYTHVWYQEAHRSADDRLLGSAFVARVGLVPVGRQELPFEENSEDTGRRMLLHARVPEPDSEPLEIVNAHFSWVPAVNQSNVAAALTYLKTLPGAVLLVGDLNAQPDSPGMRMLAEQGWADAWALLHPDDPGFTFEADAPSQRIDYVWANPAAAERLHAIERIVPEGDARVSDHLGLMVTVA